MCSIKLIYFICLLNIYFATCLISDKRLCANEDCSEPLSLATTLLRYTSPEPPLILSFAPKEAVKVYSKEAGSRPDLWGVEIKNKRGYVPKNLIREEKIFKKPTIVVDTELARTNQVPPETKVDNVEPDKVKESFEVVDGTTLYLDPSSIVPSSTESPVLSTRNPVDNHEFQDSVETEAARETNDSQEVPSAQLNKHESSADESVVEGVFSSIKSWISDDEDEEADDTNEENVEELKVIDNDKNSEESISRESSNDGKVESIDKVEEINKSSEKINDESTNKEKLEETVNSLKTEENSAESNLETPKHEPVEDQSSKNDNEQTKQEKLDQSDSTKNSAKIEMTKPIEDIDSKNQTEESTETVDAVSIEDKQETLMPENTPDVTSPTPIDLEEAIPVISTEDVTQNPNDIQQETNSISPTLELFQTKPDVNTNELRSSESTDNLEVAKEIINDKQNLQETLKEDKTEEAPKEEEKVNETPNDDSFNQTPKGEEHVEETPKDDKIEAPKIEEKMNESPKEENLKASLKTENMNENLIKEDLSDNVTQEMITENVKVIDKSPLEDILGVLEQNDVPISEVFKSKTEESGELIEETILKEEGGIFSIITSIFSRSESEVKPEPDLPPSTPISNENEILNELMGQSQSIDENENTNEAKANCDTSSIDKLIFLLTPDALLYLSTTAIACIIFIIVYNLIDRNSREAPLIQRINKLERELMITLKEKDALQEESESSVSHETASSDSFKRKLQESELYKQTLEMQIEELQREVEEKRALEEQIEVLEKELETSTEVGLELNRIISEMLDPTDGSDKLKENVEQLQRQLLEQKGIISDINKALSDKEIENGDLLNELNDSRRKTKELQGKLDEIVDQILKIEKERDQQIRSLQEEMAVSQREFRDESLKTEMLTNEIQVLKSQLSDAQRKSELKIKEYQNLKDSLSSIKSLDGDKKALQSLLDGSSIKAELEQLKIENERYAVNLNDERAAKMAFEKKCQSLSDENEALVKKYQSSDKEKVEAVMKLEVLNNYFKKREEELQSELMKYKSIWDDKEGEAASTTERIKLLTEEIENYKSQNESLKQEIVSQEIDLKSQISMLEKKVHENWVASRQLERKFEDSRQEAAQLRNRLTRERAFIEDRSQNRMQSPLDHNGELALSPPPPPPIDSATSPPMMFAGRDHMTKSPPLTGLPPFLPPPPGAPFMPPPLPFMPPPPAMFPGDHRPPPLGRMSSPPPPINSRYSPDTSAFSPYDRNTPSPPYDSEYGASPPPMRGYSPYSRDDGRDYKRPSHLSNGRNNKGSLMSSGSDHSNDSMGKRNRKMV
ncbi:unnamed protein product [Phyllotreta striolata]|uniref:Transport and Golgi organization protein 1 n=1 Tax=Phyllotreta striolata TaxID=444603 RepID=A0A9N9TWD6_PHYSR|nr:unnamed protein product [Phyllotreta striolata]